MAKQTLKEWAFTEPTDQQNQDAANLTQPELLYLYNLVTEDVDKKRREGFLNCASRNEQVAAKLRQLHNALYNSESS